MTRSIGDMFADPVGVTAEPEIKGFPPLTPFDKALVIATDGLWDRLSSEEVARLVMTPKFHQRKNSGVAADYLIGEATKRWKKDMTMIDDITVIVVYLDIEEKEKDELKQEKAYLDSTL